MPGMADDPAREIEEIVRAAARAEAIAACRNCSGTGWVCERHPERSWGGEHGCECGAPGIPCPACNMPPLAVPEGAAMPDVSAVLDEIERIVGGSDSTD